MGQVIKVDVNNYEEAIKDLKDLPKSWSWELPATGPEVCFKQLYNFLKDCESKGFDYKDKLSQLKYNTPKGDVISFFNMAGERYTYISYLLNEYSKHGDKEPPWEGINEILKIAEKKGVEFCSFSRGRGASTAAPKAQGDQLLNALVEKYTKNDIIEDPIKRNIVNILSNESLYDIPSTHKAKDDACVSYAEHKQLVNKPITELSETERKITDVKRKVKHIFEVAPNDPVLQQECADQIVKLALLNNQNENRQISGDLAEWKGDWFEEQWAVYHSLQKPAIVRPEEKVLENTVKITMVSEPEGSRPESPTSGEIGNLHKDSSGNILNTPPLPATANSPGAAALNNSLGVVALDLLTHLKPVEDSQKEGTKPTPFPRHSLGKGRPSSSSGRGVGP